MNTLILDSAYGAKAAVLISNKLVSLQHGNGLKEADNYLQVIDSALKDSKLTIDDIDTICLNVGPGSFTGLRVALSVAKGLGFDQKMKYRTFTSFDYIDSKNPKVLDGFSSFVYTSENGNMQCVDIASLKGGKYVCLNEKLKAQIESAGGKAEVVQLLPYEKIVLKSVETELKYISPLYLRASQAELQRAQKTQK